MAPIPRSRLGKRLRELGSDTPGPRAGAGRRFPSGYPLTARTAAPVPFRPVNPGRRSFPFAAGLRQAPGFLPLLHRMEERVGRGGAFLLGSPLLGPLPTRSSRGEDGELDAALPFAAVGGDAACPRPKSRTRLCA